MRKCSHEAQNTRQIRWQVSPGVALVPPIASRRLALGFLDNAEARHLNAPRSGP